MRVKCVKSNVQRNQWALRCGCVWMVCPSNHKRSQSAVPVCVRVFVCVCVLLRARNMKVKKLGALCLLSVGKDRGILEGSLYISISLFTLQWHFGVSWWNSTEEKPKEIKLQWYWCEIWIFHSNMHYYHFPYFASLFKQKTFKHDLTEFLSEYS